jgi:small-conductance mechanosensitive channel
MQAPIAQALNTLERFSDWARSDGLVALIVLCGAVLVARSARAIGGRFSRRIEERDRASESLVPAEETKRRRAIVDALTWVVVVLIYVVASVTILDRLRVPIGSLVAPATVVGVALGFGAQTIVKDLLSGFFIIAEGQYGVGDVIRISSPGSESGVSGTVEQLTLRLTSLRTDKGEAISIPNGEIRQVANLSRDWSRVVIDVPFHPGQDLDEAAAVLEQVGDDMRHDPDWSGVLLEKPRVAGVEALVPGEVRLRVTVMTLPAKQWSVGRELRLRITRACRAAGIQVAQPDATPSAPG